jgi:hypothetical protein
MDQECVAYDGYIVYRVATTRGVRFIVDQGEREENRFVVPLFRIVNGNVRGYSWDGKPSPDDQDASDYECLKANVEEAKRQFDLLEHPIPIKTTVVIVGDDGYYGIAVFPGIVVARIKEEAIPLHC